MAKTDHRKTPGPPVNDIFDFSDEALSQLKIHLEQVGLRIPVSQLVGSASVPNPAAVTLQNLVDALSALGIVSQDP